MQTNYESGHHAEQVAAAYLRAKGYTVLHINWKQPSAEIDIIAQRQKRFSRNGPLVFFEVKHRKSLAQGAGLDYITPTKLAQMQFAADLYVAQSDYMGEFVLGAIELSGEEYEVTEFIEQL